MRIIRLFTSGGFLMLVAVIMGTVTAGATLLWLGDQSEADVAGSVSPVQQAGPTREVVILLEDVPAGASLPKAALGLRRVPLDQALVGAHLDIDALVGRVVRYPLFSGEQVTEAKLVDSEASTGPGLAFAVPEGMRGVSVPVSEVTGAGGLIVPGDRVDVMVVTEYERVFGPDATPERGAESDRQPTVVTVLQDVLVLAVGQQLTGPADNGRDPATVRADDAEPQPKAASVTLAVTSEQAQVLFMASHAGPLGFAVRSFGDGTWDVLKPLTVVEPAAGASARVNRAD